MEREQKHRTTEEDEAAGPCATRVVGLCKSFGRNEVLRGCSIDFRKGMTTVVLGPSGCGKSVLLKHLVGLLHPDSGEVWVKNRRIDRLREPELGNARREIGFLFQQGALFDSLLVGGNVAFPLREHGWTDPRAVTERVRHVLHQVGLAHTINQWPSELSGGQRKRVALARAIALEPSLLLYDEPTTGLDPIRADVINEVILKLKRELGITSIVVTHDLQSAFKVADWIVMLNEGVVQLQGPPESFWESRDPIVQRFLRGEATPEDLSAIRPAGSIEPTSTVFEDNP
ncbi:MAG: ABC transporter ATP-binding protein [Planctomycetota bacterium]|nr:ABC transporter ATP-binding protein [Planctomycetota bacterium]